MSGIEFNPAIGGKGGEKTQGAFLANNDDEKKPKFTIAFNQPTGGYVSPPSSNIMGFGPASELA